MDQGFGLARVKQEGYIFNYDNGVTCDGFSRDFDVYFNSQYEFTWYSKPFKKLFKSIAQSAWNRALINVETRRQVIDSEKQ